jgi:hypothetical protein
VTDESSKRSGGRTTELAAAAWLGETEEANRVVPSAELLVSIKSL